MNDLKLTNDDYKSTFPHQINVKNVLVLSIIILTVLFFAILPFRSTQVRHLIVFLGSMLFYILAAVRLLESRYKFGLLVRISIVFFLLFFHLVLSQDFSLELIYSSLNYFSLFVLLSTDNKFGFSNTMRRILQRSIMLISFFMMIASISPVAYVFEDGRSTQALVLGMTNPNLTAMMILCTINLLLMFYIISKWKYLQAVFIIVLVYLLWLTEARASIITAFIMFIYMIFCKKEKLNKLFVLIPIAVSILFVPIYLQLFTNYSDMSLFLGKSLFSGRQFVFQYNLSMLDTPIHVLFGNFEAAKFGNAHNAPLTILCTLGIIGFIFTYYSYAIQLIKLNNRNCTAQARIGLVAILCIFIQSSAESLLLLGVFPSISFLFFFMVIADENGNNKETRALLSQNPLVQ